MTSIIGGQQPGPPDPKWFVTVLAHQVSSQIVVESLVTFPEPGEEDPESGSLCSTLVGSAWCTAGLV